MAHGMRHDARETQHAPDSRGVEAMAPRRVGRIVWLAALLTACAQDPVTTPTAQAVDLSAASTAVVVANVNGAPIDAHCVANQMRALGVARTAALEQCIDFELLAQAANQRGYGADPEVVDAMRTEAVRQLLQRDFAATHARPEDLPPGLLDAAYEQNKRRFQHPEYRFAHYVRAEVDASEPLGSAADRAAERAARRIYLALRGERGLTPQRFYELAAAAAEEGARIVSDEGKAAFDFPRHGRAVEPFAAAAFAIPEVGMVAPPARTEWGWDVILLTRIMPAADVSREQAGTVLFASLRRNAFLNWINERVPPAAVEIDREALEALTHAEQDSRQVTP